MSLLGRKTAPGGRSASRASGRGDGLFATLRLLCAVCVTFAVRQLGAQGSLPNSAQPPATPELRQGRELLAGKQFAAAKILFAGYLQQHPADLQAELGLGDAELGLRRYEAAELVYRAAIAQQPELWQAHKNLVVVEAALGRWEDFEGERKILRLAREREAPGISARESDVIDSLQVEGERWMVRSYFEPLGRSRAVYNFERFSAAGRVEAYLSLEDAQAAAAALHGGDVRIGGEDETSAPAAQPPKSYTLNWYTGTAHGTIRQYRQGEPGYPQLRRDVLAWLRSSAAKQIRSLY